MREILFKILFPEKHRLINDYEERVDDLEDQLIERPSMNDLMLDSIGLPYIDFTNTNEYGRPPSYMSGLSEVERKNYIAELVAIQRNPKFEAVINYCVNMLGNHSILVFEDEKKKAGQHAIIGIRTVTREFEKAVNEHTTGVRDNSEWDPLAAIPE